MHDLKPFRTVFKSIARLVDTSPMSLVVPWMSPVVAERRGVERGDLPSLSAIRLIEDVAPHALPAFVVEVASRIAGCDTALYVTDIGGSALQLVAGGSRWPHELPVPQALGPELTRGRMGELQQQLAESMPGSAAIPLWLQGRAVAVLVCARQPDPGLEAFAREAAVAIKLSDAYTDVFHRARRRRNTTPVAELQENLLPPRVAQLHGAELAAGVIPAYTIGGDWFDYASNPEGAWIGVADAAGKGPASAGTSSVALGAFRGARRAGGALPEVSRAIDRAVGQLSDMTFVTAVLGHWSGRRREFDWLRFGHPYPILMRADGEIEVLKQASQLPLGLLANDARLVPHTISLGRGDRLLLTSDGVWERRRDSGEPIDEDGILAMLSEIDEPGALPIATALLEAVMDANVEGPRDDATVLVLAA